MLERHYHKLWSNTEKRYVGESVAAESKDEAYRLFTKASVLASREDAINPDHSYQIIVQPNAKYGWMITRDHLWEDSRLTGSLAPDEQPEVGIIGPSNISPDLNEALEVYKAQLLAGEVPKRIDKNQKTFKMFDDDGILYYTGIAIGNFEGQEPLKDFGGPNAGCTLIQWPRYPEMTAEY